MVHHIISKHIVKNIAKAGASSHALAADKDVKRPPFRSRVGSTSSSPLQIILHHIACDTALIFQGCCAKRSLTPLIIFNKNCLD